MPVVIAYETISFRTLKGEVCILILMTCVQNNIQYDFVVRNHAVLCIMVYGFKTKDVAFVVLDRAVCVDR